MRQSYRCPFTDICGTLQRAMAGRMLSSDPQYLLSVMDELGEESGSEDEFDGWVEEREASPFDDAQLQHTSPAPLRTRSRSLESLDAARERASLEASPTHSPMQLQATEQDSHAGASPTPSALAETDVLPAQSESPTPPNHHDTAQHTSTSSSPPSFTAEAGVIPDTESMAPVDFFRLMFDDRVFNIILTETERYASQYLEREREYLESHPKARAHDWRKTDLTLKEVEAFVAVLIAMGLCGFPTQR